MLYRSNKGKTFSKILTQLSPSPLSFDNVLSLSTTLHLSHSQVLSPTSKPSNHSSPAINSIIGATYNRLHLHHGQLHTLILSFKLLMFFFSLIPTSTNSSSNFISSFASSQIRFFIFYFCRVGLPIWGFQCCMGLPSIIFFNSF